MGKEGIKYAVDDMTKTKLIVFGWVSVIYKFLDNFG
jgi:hypothetical protein